MAIAFPTSKTNENNPVQYPTSDGKPMAENTLQFQYIVMIKEGLETLFADNPDVFVAGDLLWYPVQGDNRTRVAPDAMVAFGRPKGYRGSYMQWVEDGIAPQVVFEILSPGNRAGEITAKALFYKNHGVEEYYIFDPDEGEFAAFHRDRTTDTLEPVSADADGFWYSPRLGVRFTLSNGELVVLRPDGERFKTHTELMTERNAERERANRAEERANVAEERANQAEDRATDAEAKAARLAERLRELGIDPNSL
jgi:Uma2 family endonuclease